MIFIITSISIFAISACDNDIKTDCIEVRLVEDVCGNAILQVVNGDSNLSLGTWVDQNDNGRIYENVFGTFLNPCANNFPEDRESPFFVTLADSTEKTDCIVCLALLSNMPEQFYHIRIVDPCELSSID